ncbi:MAG: FtsX-like permease family protein [Huintestinicola sp.]
MARSGNGFIKTAFSIASRFLKHQKKHTIMTVIAVILATAFMTVMLTAVSVYSETSLNISKVKNGTYEIIFSGLSKADMVTVRSMDIFDKTEIYGASVYTSRTDIDFGQYQDPEARMEYLICNGMIVDDWFMRIDPDSVTMLPESMTAVTEGRLPAADGELVINLTYADSWGNPEIGDTVELTLLTCGSKDITTKEGTDLSAVPSDITDVFGVESAEPVTLTVVGYSEGYNIVHYSDTRLRSYTMAQDNLIAHFADFTNDLYWDLHHAFQDNGMEIDDYDYSFNQELLNAEGKGVTAKYYKAVFMLLVYLVVVFLMFCVRMVIDNSFEISSKERVQQFGLLKAVGASSKQIFIVTAAEGLILAAIGVPVGTAAGYLASAGVFSAICSIDALSMISSAYDLRDMLVFSTPPYIFISSVVIGVLWVLISAVGTGMRVIRATPVDAMRMGSHREKFKISRFRPKVGTGRGFITAYAGLNLKRNKKRYIITLVSMTISMCLFAGFSYMLDLADTNLRNEYDFSRQPYQFSVNLSVFDSASEEEAVSMLSDSGLFEEIQRDSEIYMLADSDGMFADPKYLSSGKILLYIHPVSKETYNKYIAAGSGVSYSDIEENEGILICRDTYSDDKRLKKETVFASSVAASVSGRPVITFTSDILDRITVPVIGTYTTDNTMYQSVGSSITAIAPESVYDKLFADCGYMDNNTSVYAAPDGELYYLYRRDIALNAKPGSEDEALNFLKRHFYSCYTDNLTDESSALALLSTFRIAGYFIIAVLTMIAIVNIVNIISTNVLNRTSELGMLRACGMSDKQIMSLVRYESLSYAMLSAISTVLVIVLMVFAVQIPFRYGKGYVDENDLTVALSYVAPMKYVAISAAAAFIVAALASVLPAKRIIDTPIVETIRNIE